MSLCKQLAAVSKRQITQPSTWRGLAIGMGTIITLVNPAAGAAVLKAVAGTVAVIDVLKNDSK